MTNDITKKLRTECVTVLRGDEIVGQVVINEIDDEHSNLSQSDLFPDNSYDFGYEQTKILVENSLKKSYGNNIKFMYSNLNKIGDKE
jgi:hypothetical protein